MKQDKLQSIWRRSLYNTKIYSQEELDKILSSKMEVIMKKHLRLNALSIFTGLIAVVLLIYAAIERSSDIYYIVNNIIACVIVALCVVFAIWSFYKMNVNSLCLPLKDWLAYRMKALSISQSRARYTIRFFTMILIFILLFLSFFVYFINRPLVDVITNRELHPALIIGFAGGIITSLVFFRNIKTYYSKSLAQLKDLYNQFEDE
ncbi:MAG: hypothetical protein ACK5KT_13460 [Dysgonomonas sp.]